MKKYIVILFFYLTNPKQGNGQTISNMVPDSSKLDYDKTFSDFLQNLDSEELQYIQSSGKEGKKYLKYYDQLMNEGRRSIKQNLPLNTATEITLKNYKYKEQIKYDSPFVSFLDIPHGRNLPTIIQNNPEISEIAGEYFKQYNLNLVNTENDIEIQKYISGSYRKMPYELMADTLRRIIFHIAAILSNRDSIILFEEPEAHSYSPYIVKLATQILAEKTNQYFIVTHSPYLINELFDESYASSDSVALHVCYNDPGNDFMKIKNLNSEEIANVINNGTDVFMNYNSLFQKHV
ncbi:MAG: AAA family ATPase [Bacteroidota bacterium]|nr:AAA family ATPase [Bacteroidota bacterium]